MDHIQAWSTLATAIAAFLALMGLGIAYWSAGGTRRQLRLQTGPYVRVDVGVLGTEARDMFIPPTPYYVREDAAEIGDPSTDKVTIGIWVRNLQTHPLGVAIGVVVNLLVYIDRPVIREEPIEAQIAYVSTGQPIRIDLLKVPRDWQFGAYLASVQYRDLYDRRHLHLEGDKGTEAAYGRFECEYDGTTYDSVPTAWPKGPKLVYPEDEEDNID